MAAMELSPEAYETMLQMDEDLVNHTRSGRLVRTPARHRKDNSEKVEFFKSMPKDRMTSVEKIRHSKFVTKSIDKATQQRNRKGEERYNQLWAQTDDDDITTWPSLQQMLDCWE